MGVLRPHVQQLALAAGRFLLVIAATLLVAKHVVWFARYRHRQERRRRRVIRASAELVAGAAVAALHAQSIVFDGWSARLASTESLIQVWAFALLFVGLVIGRSDGPPPPDC